MNSAIQPGQKWSDQKVETIIGRLLATGVYLSAFVVACGAVIYLLHYGPLSMSYREFKGEPEALKSIPGIFHYALQAHGRGIIQLGLLLLIATPVARVAFSIFVFAVQRDRMYVLFTIVVLLILLYSLFGSSAMV